jgi:hypothetical protein
MHPSFEGVIKKVFAPSSFIKSIIKKSFFIGTNQSPSPFNNQNITKSLQILFFFYQKINIYISYFFLQHKEQQQEKIDKAQYHL